MDGSGTVKISDVQNAIGETKAQLSNLEHNYNYSPVSGNSISPEITSFTTEQSSKLDEIAGQLQTGAMEPGQAMQQVQTIGDAGQGLTRRALPLINDINDISTSQTGMGGNPAEEMSRLKQIIAQGVHETSSALNYQLAQVAEPPMAAASAASASPAPSSTTSADEPKHTTSPTAERAGGIDPPIKDMSQLPKVQLAGPRVVLTEKDLPADISQPPTTTTPADIGKATYATDDNSLAARIARGEPLPKVQPAGARVSFTEEGLEGSSPLPVTSASSDAASRSFQVGQDVKVGRSTAVNGEWVADGGYRITGIEDGKFTAVKLVDGQEISKSGSVKALAAAQEVPDGARFNIAEAGGELKATIVGGASGVPPVGRGDLNFQPPSGERNAKPTVRDQETGMSWAEPRDAPRPPLSEAEKARKSQTRLAAIEHDERIFKMTEADKALGTMKQVERNPSAYGMSRDQVSKNINDLESAKGRLRGSGSPFSVNVNSAPAASAEKIMQIDKALASLEDAKASPTAYGLTKGEVKTLSAQLQTDKTSLKFGDIKPGDVSIPKLSRGGSAGSASADSVEPKTSLAERAASIREKTRSVVDKAASKSIAGDLSASEGTASDPGFSVSAAKEKVAAGLSKGKGAAGDLFDTGQNIFGKAGSAARQAGDSLKEVGSTAKATGAAKLAAVTSGESSVRSQSVVQAKQQGEVDSFKARWASLEDEGSQFKKAIAAGESVDEAHLKDYDAARNKLASQMRSRGISFDAGGAPDFKNMSGIQAKTASEIDNLKTRWASLEDEGAQYKKQIAAGNSIDEAEAKDYQTARNKLASQMKSKGIQFDAGGAPDLDIGAGSRTGGFVKVGSKIVERTKVLDGAGKVADVASRVLANPTVDKALGVTSKVLANPVVDKTLRVAGPVGLAVGFGMDGGNLSRGGAVMIGNTPVHFGTTSSTYEADMKKALTASYGPGWKENSDGSFQQNLYNAKGKVTGHTIVGIKNGEAYQHQEGTGALTADLAAHPNKFADAFTSPLTRLEKGLKPHSPAASKLHTAGPGGASTSSRVSSAVDAGVLRRGGPKITGDSLNSQKAKHQGATGSTTMTEQITSPVTGALSQAKQKIAGLSATQTLPAKISVQELEGWGWNRSNSSAAGTTTYTKNGNAIVINGNGQATYTNNQAATASGRQTQRVQVEGLIPITLTVESRTVTPTPTMVANGGDAGTTEPRTSNDGTLKIKHDPVSSAAAKRAVFGPDENNRGLGSFANSASPGDVQDARANAHPAAYSGGAAIKGVSYLKNGSTLTTTVTGAEVETTAAGNSFVVKKADVASSGPAHISGGDVMSEHSLGMGDSLGNAHSPAYHPAPELVSEHGGFTTKPDSEAVGPVALTNPKVASHASSFAPAPELISEHGGAFKSDAEAVGPVAITNPKGAAISADSPGPYTGGAAVESVKELKNGGTLTTTATGAEVETTAAGNSYTVKKADPVVPVAAASASASDDVVSRMLSHADSAPAASPASSTPASVSSSSPSVTMAPTTQQDIARAAAPVRPSIILPPPSMHDPTVAASFGGGLNLSSSAPRGGSCFPAGSLVMTPEGQKPIETINEGDEINIWNLHKHEVSSSKVTKKLTHESEPTLQIETTVGSLAATPEHRFWTGHDWVPAGKLAVGSSVFDSSGNLQSVTQITAGPTEIVYNLHVDSPEHNYFVNGLLVHNMKMAQ